MGYTSHKMQHNRCSSHCLGLIERSPLGLERTRQGETPVRFHSGVLKCEHLRRSLCIPFLSHPRVIGQGHVKSFALMASERSGNCDSDLD